MRISPVNNNNQNTNFGMIKVVDANTPELAQEAWRILIDIMPNNATYNPFRVADALNPNYKARFGVQGETFYRDGGHYMGKHLHQDKLPTYAAEGNKVFVFDEELKRKNECDYTPFAERFDAAFSNPVRITIAKLREFATIIKAQKDTVTQAEKALTEAKTANVNVHNDVVSALGADFLKINLPKK